MRASVFFFVALLTRASSVGTLPSGVAAWVYDVSGGEPAMWASDIAAFNAIAKKPINTIFSYGGDLEYYAGPDPFKVYFPPENVAAVAAYKRVAKNVIAVVDGRMDGGEPYSPDLTKFTTAQIKEWADNVATLYCSYDDVDGIQLDLEPFSGKYVTPFLVFLSQLAGDLRAPERNCVSATHPDGRSITTFLSAWGLTDDV